MKTKKSMLAVFRAFIEIVMAQIIITIQIADVIWSKRIAREILKTIVWGTKGFNHFSFFGENLSQAKICAPAWTFFELCVVKWPKQLANVDSVAMTIR